MKTAALLMVFLVIMLPVCFADSVAFVPAVSEGQEIENLGYKFSNHANIIVATEPYVSCIWKPDSIDDGWKNCEAVFEVENQNNITSIISSPKINFNFQKDDIKNQQISFSNTFDLVQENYVDFIDGNETSIRQEHNFTKRQFNNFVSLPTTIDTSKPFAIKLTYEAPKYSGNQFNFSLSGEEFAAFIDPIQSSCGTLATAGETYTLDRSVNKTGTCFTVGAGNIILNCKGYTINYSSAGTLGYGVYNVGHDWVTIKNCKIKEGKAATNNKHAIYFSNADNGRINNNTIRTIGAYSMGIYFGGANLNILANNTINTSGLNADGINFDTPSDSNNLTNNVIKSRGRGIYLESSDLNILARNNITANGTSGIYLVTGSTSNSLINNILIGRGIIAYSSGSSYIVGNTITVLPFTSNGYGLYLSSSSGTVIDNNTISTNGSSNDGIDLRVTGANFNNITNNFIETRGTSAYGINLRDQADNNLLFNNTIITHGTSGYGVNLVISSSTNDLINNSISTYGSSGYGIYLNNAYPNDMINNKVLTTGSSAHGIYLYSLVNLSLLLNNNLSAAKGYEIYDNTGNSYINYLVYNNSYGEIKWTNTSNNGFLKDMDVNGSIGLKNNLFMINNSAVLTMSAFQSELSIDSKANITFFSVHYNNLNSYHVLKDKVYCTDCVKLGFNPVKFQVAGFNGAVEYITVDNVPPTHTAPILNSTFGTNLTYENLTCYNRSTADIDNNLVKNIYNWHLNGKSITVLNMPFEGINRTATNNSYDYSGYGNNGKDSGANIFWNATGGYDGRGAYRFYGINDRITIPDADSLDVSNTMTISAWIKPNVITQGAIVSKYWPSPYPYLLFLSNGQLYSRLNDVLMCGSGAGSVSAGKWQHVALTYDKNLASNNVALYINGALKCNSNYATDIGKSTGTVLIGARQTAAATYDVTFNGTIDDVMIFNRSLTKEQIRNIYRNQTNQMSYPETQIGDSWKCGITPNDGFGDGIALKSNNLTILAVDTHPRWSNNKTGIVINYSLTRSYFNITWVDDKAVSSVRLESNYSGIPANYSMNNIGGNIYNYSFILPAGVHYWKSWANDSADQWNVSTKWSFKISNGPVTYDLIYDANGNLLSGDGYNRTYNSLNQLSEIRNNAGVLLESFTYHPTEERILVKKVYYNNGSVREKVIYLDENYVRVTNSSGNFNYTYVKHEGQLVAQLINPGGSKYYIHGNHEGSSTVITNQAGAVIENTLYAPFGEIVSGGSNRFDYEGKEYDSVVKDYDFHFRKYNPKWDLFIQPDTLIQNVYDPQSLNRYMFERGNPYGRTDPSGHVAKATINTKKKEITIKSTIYIYGKGASDKVAQRIQKEVNKAYSGGIFAGGKSAYRVDFKINVAYAKEKPNELGKYENAVEIKGFGSGLFHRSFVSGDRKGGEWSTFGVYGLGSQIYAHEVGHLLGLRDRYSDKNLLGFEYTSVSNEGYENSLMGADEITKLNQQDLNNMLSNAYEEHQISNAPSMETEHILDYED